MLLISRHVGWSNVSRCIRVNYLNLIINQLNQELVQCRGNATINVNSIVDKNNTIVTLHLDNEEWVARDLLPMVSSMETTSLGSIELPPRH
jgi:hypothetical protein